jgi:hypothetical protein
MKNAKKNHGESVNAFDTHNVVDNDGTGDPERMDSPSSNLPGVSPRAVREHDETWHFESGAGSQFHDIDLGILEKNSQQQETNNANSHSNNPRCRSNHILESQVIDIEACTVSSRR